MIENYKVDQNTQEVSGVYKNEAFTIPPKVVDGALQNVSEQECVQILEFREKANAMILTNQYKSLRISAYPSFADQFDTIFHEGLDAWKAQIQAIKDKYPKE